MTHIHEQFLRGLILYAPAITLCLLGLFIALRSGDVSLGSADGLRRLATNASSMALRLFLWILAILAVVEIIGAGVLLRAQ